MEASEGDALEMGDRPHYYSDDHLWIILAVCAYLKETGDLGFLEEVVPYYDKKAPESGTVRDHLRRAIAFTQTNVGAHGLPLLGFADWNDTINLRTGAESLFTANLYGKALRELIELAEYEGDTAGQFTGCYEEMRQRVNAHAWDGRWFIRYFDFDGQPLGSHRNSTGQVYANGQSWPVISGFASEEHARLALDTVYERLNTRSGSLSTPGFNGFDPNVGGVSTYPRREGERRHLSARNPGWSSRKR
jgi:cellobiose phosphorylase